MHTISIASFLVFLICACLQGYIIPAAYIYLKKYHTVESKLILTGALVTLADSFYVMTWLPDIHHRLRLSDFENGYLKLTHSVTPFYWLLFIGMMLILAPFLKICVKLWLQRGEQTN
jgi:hypothetical protein